MEPAPTLAKGREFYIPHKEVVRESAQTTKLRVVYDASARADPTCPSLNDCLYSGPPLQNHLWDVLVRQRAYPVALTGDIKKAFLQIRIKEEDRDSLRFHWRTNGQAQIETLRFTRALFGLGPSPFLLNGVLGAHLDAWEERRPDIVAELRDGLYVDDLLTGGNTVDQASAIKQGAIEVLGDATFELHKWASNVPQLENPEASKNSEEDQSAAKQQLAVKPTETKLLGHTWEKEKDILNVEFDRSAKATTKREVLSKLARIYDPLSLTSPLTLQGKLLYRDIIDTKVPWDTKLQGEIEDKWKKWEQSLPTRVGVPRSIVLHRERVTSMTLHGFGDASQKGVSAAVYTVVNQPSGETQSLVAAKSRIAKRGLTIQRLKLVAAHMVTNLPTNVHKNLSSSSKVTIPQHAWLDSTVALY